MNQALGKYYHTKDDYLGDVKRMGLEPYTGPQPKRKLKEYKLDRDAVDMIHQAASYEKRHEKPGSRFIKKFSELGTIEAPKWLRDGQSLVGGFKGEE